MKWTEKQLDRLGFTTDSWDDDMQTYTEYYKDNGSIRIEITETGEVGITKDEAHYYDVPNCNTLDDLKKLCSLFNLI
jgi:hypothetical protein